MKTKIRVSITYKSVQVDIPCFKHYLEIFDGSLPTNQSLGRICLNTEAVDVSSTGPDLYLMLWIESDLDEENRPIFSASYQEVKGDIFSILTVYYNDNGKILPNKLLTRTQKI